MRMEGVEFLLLHAITVFGVVGAISVNVLPVHELAGAKRLEPCTGC